MAGFFGDLSVCLARDAGVDEGTIRKILSGQSWADFHTIWSLESTLDTSLYSR
ncbi:helix-turn-helix domain-containing protein [Microbacterium phyllosphaerae]|uniref:helix-turn-helix domain-containing protein n=1 Tax=Microbacterium phyllosphaerae TaxID=124798 RepID=UPI001AE803E2